MAVVVFNIKSRTTVKTIPSANILLGVLDNSIKIYEPGDVPAEVKAVIRGSGGATELVRTNEMGDLKVPVYEESVKIKIEDSGKYKEMEFTARPNRPEKVYVEKISVYRW